MSKLPRRIAVAVGLLCFHAIAARAFVTGVTVDPPQPTSHDVVHLTLTGQRWLFQQPLIASVTPASPQFEAPGTILLTFAGLPAPPLPPDVPFAQTVAVGPLPEGLYHVETVDGLFTARLVVNDLQVSSQSLFLVGQRFEVSVAWHTGAAAGAGQPEALTDGSGYFWFFDPRSPEVLVKVIDGTPVNGHFWVFLGGLSDVDYTVTVTDRFTGKARTYANPRGTVASRADTSAFASGS